MFNKAVQINVDIKTIPKQADYNERRAVFNLNLGWMIPLIYNTIILGLCTCHRCVRIGTFMLIVLATLSFFCKPHEYLCALCVKVQLCKSEVINQFHWPQLFSRWNNSVCELEFH